MKKTRSKLNFCFTKIIVLLQAKTSLIWEAVMRALELGQEVPAGTGLTAKWGYS